MFNMFDPQYEKAKLLGIECFPMSIVDPVSFHMLDFDRYNVANQSLAEDLMALLQGSYPEIP